MKKEYKPTTPRRILGYLTEEAGEVLAAVGKSMRWGLTSTNPELPPEERETNGEWILRELKDLKRAVRMAEDMLQRHDHEDLDQFEDDELNSIAERER